MSNLFVLPRQVALNASGGIQAGAKAYFYSAGTNTAKNTYSDATLTTPHANPVIANSGGQFPAVYLDTADGEYRLTLKTSDEVLIYTQDGVGQTQQLTAQDIGELLHPRSAAEILLEITPDNYTYPEGHVWRYLSSSQLAVVRDFTFAQDVTTRVQDAMSVAWEAGCECFVPAGGYLVTGLVLPGKEMRRERFFRLRGAGAGEIFDRSMDSGTIFKSTSDAPILVYVPDKPSTGNGNAEVCYIRFEGDSSGYVIDFDSFYIQSEFHHCNVFQAGTGGGMRIGLSNTIDIHHNYLINRDWNTLERGADRTGVALFIEQSIDTGLTLVRKNTFRGFKDGHIINSGATAAFSHKVEHCECSLTFNGITIADGNSKVIIDSCYLEGGDGGTAIKDDGNYSVISNNLIFPGYSVGIDASNQSKYGTLITGNVLSAGSRPGSQLLRLGSSGAAGGPGKIATGNTLTFSGSGGSITNVIGMVITGIEPRLELDNVFDPRGPWIGGAGTVKVSDASTGGGVYGFGKAYTGDYELPLVSRGAMSWGRANTLGNLSIAGSVLNLTEASYHVLAATNAATVNSIMPLVLDGKEFIVRTVNANVTFANSSALRMAGGVSFTPGANGAMITFVVEKNVVYERCRTAY